MDRDSPVGFLKITILVAAALCFVGYVLVQSENTDRPVKAMESMGFTDVRITDGSALGSLHGCGESLAYKATGTNPAGAKVDMLVCCGAVLKGCTVRSR